MAHQDACPICGAGREPGARACTACGESFDEAPDGVERIRARRELDHLLSVLESLRRIYLVLALLLGGVCFTVLLMGGYGIRGNTLASAITVLLAVAAASCAVAAWDVYRHPRIWSLLLAGVVTPLLLLAAADLLLAGPNLLRVLRLVLLALGASGLWYGAVQCLSMGDLLRRHPDLRSARRLRERKHGLPEGTAARHMRERGQVEDAARHRHALVFGGSATGAALLLAMGAWAWFHPPLEPSVDGFRASWNAADWAAIEERFEPGLRDRMGKSLGILLRRRGWHESPPALETARIEETRAGGSRALFPVGGDSVETGWKLRDGTWVLTSVRLPER